MREEFTIERNGKTYVLFAGLLDEAHNRGLSSIDTELVQVPEEANSQVAIVKATVKVDGEGESRGRTFSGIGDASPNNVGSGMAPHLIRMAETRAKARALRDAVNVSATALEEISDSDDDGSRNGSGGGGSGSRSSGSSPGRGSRSGNSSSGSSDSRSNDSGAGNGPGDKGSSGKESGGGDKEKAHNSQIEFIKTLAHEWRGDKGVERLESRIGKSIEELTREEAEEWVDRLTPADKTGEAATDSGG